MFKKFLSLSVLLSLVFAMFAVPVSAAEESDLHHVQEKGTLVIGYTVYAPMNYTDENGVFTGFDTELAMAVAQILGVTPEFVEIDWNTKEIELAAKNIDCIWNGLTITDDRKAQMNITIPYVKNAQAVVIKEGSEYESTASLIGKVIAAEAGSAGETIVQEDANLSQAELISKEVQTACLMEVKAGTAYAAVLDLTLANAMVGKDGDYVDLKIVDRLGVEDYGVAFRKGSDIAEKVNKAFLTLKEQGFLQELAQKYGLDLAV